MLAEVSAWSVVCILFLFVLISEHFEQALELPVFWRTMVLLSLYHHFHRRPRNPCQRRGSAATLLQQWTHEWLLSERDTEDTQLFRHRSSKTQVRTLQFQNFWNDSTSHITVSSHECSVVPTQLFRQLVQVNANGNIGPHITVQSCLIIVILGKSAAKFQNDVKTYTISYEIYIFFVGPSFVPVAWFFVVSSSASWRLYNRHNATKCVTMYWRTWAKLINDKSQYVTTQNETYAHFLRSDCHHK